MLHTMLLISAKETTLPSHNPVLQLLILQSSDDTHEHQGNYVPIYYHKIKHLNIVHFYVEFVKIRIQFC